MSFLLLLRFWRHCVYRAAECDGAPGTGICCGVATRRGRSDTVQTRRSHSAALRFGKTNERAARRGKRIRWISAKRRPHEKRGSTFEQGKGMTLDFLIKAMSRAS